MKNRYLLNVIIIILSFWIFTGCSKEQIQVNYNLNSEISSFNLDNIPVYSGRPFVSLDNNTPNFTESDKTTISFENYSTLDSLGRCGIAFANIGIDIMPVEERGSIGQVKPTGWHTVKYDNVDGKYLYNRCHLIGYQLSAENANEQNLITGTRYLNIEGMLPFENMVSDYIKETNNHVLYRVTPIFEGNNLVANGVQMEAYSVEDAGEGICFNVYVYNVQPGIIIDYSTGESQLVNDTVTDEQYVTVDSVEIRGNANSKIYHCPGQTYYDEMQDSKYLVIFNSEEEAQEEGYRKARK